MNAHPPAQSVVYTFGSFQLDSVRHQLVRGDAVILLPAKVHETLLLLARSSGRVVEKDEFFATIWPDAFVTEGSLAQAISAVRKALGDDSNQPTYIATIPRRGYKFLPHVTSTPQAAASGAAAALTDAPASLAPNGSEIVVSIPSAGRRSGRSVWLVVPAVLAVALLARPMFVNARGEPTSPAITFLQDAPPDTLLASGGTLSPDGRWLAFLAQDAATGQIHLWLRTLDAPTPRLVAGTHGAYKPFWSPDSRSIAFFAEGKLKRVGVAAASPRVLAPVGYLPSGGSWSSRGVIIFADRRSQLFVVSDTGGEARSVTTLDPTRSETGHHAPQFLPDGDHFLFTTSASERAGNATYVGSLTAPGRTKLLDDSASNAIFAPPGYLLYVRENALVAQPFDADSMRLHDSATALLPVTSAAFTGGPPYVGALSASANGLLTFGGELPQNQLAWFSRDGTPGETIPAPPNLHNPMISPDGHFLIGDSLNTVWLVDLLRGARTRLSTEGALAAWSHDGTRVSFTSRRTAPSTAIVRRSINGSERDTMLIQTDEMKLPGNWTADGHFLTYTTSNPTSRLDLWFFDAGSGLAKPYLKTAANELQPQISPDGGWIAYTSDESSAWEVYVDSFPTAGQKRMVSVGGGAQPEWRRDGRELFYLAPDATLMSMEVSVSSTFEAAPPRPLFQLPIATDLISYRNQYAVAGTGRFVVDLAGRRDPINIIVNWTALLTP